MHESTCCVAVREAENTAYTRPDAQGFKAANLFRWREKGGCSATKVLIQVEDECEARELISVSVVRVLAVDDA